MKFEKLDWMFDSQKVRNNKWCRKRKLKSIIIQSKQEARFLYKMAHKYADYNIVELGRKYGGSTVVMASGIKKARGKGKIYSIDSSEHNYGFSKKFIKGMGCFEYVEIILGDTREQCVDLGLKVAFVLFDAIHSYNIMDEFNMWYKHIMDGGYMLVHDYGMEKHPGVTKAVNKYVENNNVDIVHRVNRIAVIKKNKG